MVPLYEDGPRQVLPQKVLVPRRVLSGDDAVEGVALLYAQHAPGHQAALPEVVEDRSALVADLDDTHPPPSLGLAQGAGPLGR